MRYIQVWRMVVLLEKNAYFTFNIGEDRHKVILSGGLDEKAKYLNVGDLICIDYIKGEFFYNSLIIIDFNKLTNFSKETKICH